MIKFFNGLFCGSSNAHAETLRQEMQMQKTRALFAATPTNHSTSLPGTDGEHHAEAGAGDGVEAPALRPETTSEHIARDMREGRFPEKSPVQMVPVEAPAHTEPVAWALFDYDGVVCSITTKQQDTGNWTPLYAHPPTDAAEIERLRAEVVKYHDAWLAAEGKHSEEQARAEKAKAERDAALARVAGLEASLADASAAHETALAHWKAAADVISSLAPPPDADLDALVDLIGELGREVYYLLDDCETSGEIGQEIHTITTEGLEKVSAVLDKIDALPFEEAGVILGTGAKLQAAIKQTFATALRARPAGVTVKPLVWESGDGETRSEDCFTARDGFGGTYTVIEGQWWHGLTGCQVCDSDKDAKAAAQADYEARILAALTSNMAQEGEK